MTKEHTLEQRALIGSICSCSGLLGSGQKIGMGWEGKEMGGSGVGFQGGKTRGGMGMVLEGQLSEFLEYILVKIKVFFFGKSIS